MFVHSWLMVSVFVHAWHTPAEPLDLWGSVGGPGLESHTAPAPWHLGPLWASGAIMDTVWPLGPLWPHLWPLWGHWGHQKASWPFIMQLASRQTARMNLK